ncbi:hypothetical protein IWQ60_006916 [Tieghemiomyces parasiticus]|uniref:Amino acid permease/ SLC12A domain-containing protein n=1 Tax=Tieghemiomyces parasiticus TaxID=78921 RepID=A0A9W8A1X6_9FUNG|nr:hypothetical protein IWQ60_006916 [Tieghemiomyces parasiticus]
MTKAELPGGTESRPASGRASVVSEVKSIPVGSPPPYKMDVEVEEKPGSTHSGDSDAPVELKRTLKERHMTMIAIGGTIGTGLFIGSGTALADAGPAGCLMAYALVGIMVFFVMSSLGELATYMPVSGSFNTYGGRFVDPAFGFALGWNYWFSWTVTVASELVATGIIIQFWLPHITGVIWSAIAMGIMFALNAISVKGYGESEYWFSLIKIVAVIVFIIIGVFTDAGVIGNHQYGFENWTREGAPFNNGVAGIIQSFIVSGFSFQGTELVGVAAGESENPRRDVPRAIRQVFWRILIFYILATFIMGLIIPFDDPLLVQADGVGDVGISPFTLVFQKAGLRPAAHIMNAVILITVLSAGNSGLYCCARTLWTLSMEGKAPRFLRRITKGGIPIYCLMLTTLVASVFFALSFIGNQVVYTWLVNLSGITGFMAWLGIAISHWRFRRAYVAQGYDVGALPYRALAFPFGPIIALTITSFVILGQGWPSFSNGFNVGIFLSSYLGLPIFVILFLFWRFYKRTSIVPLVDVDVLSDTRNFDDIGMTEVVEQTV